jgi:hypothetical protein
VCVCVFVCSLLCIGSGGIQFLCSILEQISSNSKTYNIARFFRTIYVHCSWRMMCGQVTSEE